jgi:5'-phosphate synthase pdxT subunit
MRVGVLALQGGFAPHVAALEALGHEAHLVRAPADLDGVEGLVLPGGESTAQRRLLQSSGLAEPLRRSVDRGAAVLATCAGLILAAARTGSADEPGFGWLDLTLARNAWGRQVDSFEAIADGVEVRASYQGEPVLVRSGRVVGATFHPELTGDRRVHREAFGEGGRAA